MEEGQAEKILLNAVRMGKSRLGYNIYDLINQFELTYKVTIKDIDLIRSAVWGKEIGDLINVRIETHSL